MKENFLKLTDTVYKVLEFFPESDPLKNRAKDKALSIMENLILVNDGSGWTSIRDIVANSKIKAQVSEDIDILLGYLWIGKLQGWLNSVNCLIITNEYEKIKKEIEPETELTQKLPGIEKEPVVIAKKQSPPSDNLTARQRKILEFLVKNNKAQVMDLQTVLPDITKRTIRRDIDDLLEAKKIVRMGDFNQVFYQLPPGSVQHLIN